MNNSDAAKTATPNGVNSIDAAAPVTQNLTMLAAIAMDTVRERAQSSSSLADDYSEHLEYVSLGLRSFFPPDEGMASPIGSRSPHSERTVDQRGQNTIPTSNSKKKIQNSFKTKY